MKPIGACMTYALVSAMCSACTATVNVNRLVDRSLGTGPQDTILAEPVVTVSRVFDSRVYRRLAVYARDETDTRITDGGVHAVEDQFIEGLLGKGYVLAERSALPQVLSELGVQQSQVTEPALARAGRFLNVSAVVLVNVTRLTSRCGTNRGENYCYGIADLSARLIDAESGEVLWVGNGSGAVRVLERANSERAVGAVARRLALEFPGRTMTSGTRVPEPRQSNQGPYWGLGAVRILPASRGELPGAPTFMGPYIEVGLLGPILDGTIRYGHGFPWAAPDSTLRASSAKLLSVELSVGRSGAWGALRAGVGVSGVFFPESSPFHPDSVPPISFLLGGEIPLGQSARLAVGAVYIPHQYAARSSRVSAVAAHLGLRWH